MSVSFSQIIWPIVAVLLCSLALAIIGLVARSDQDPEDWIVDAESTSSFGKRMRALGRRDEIRG